MTKRLASWLLVGMIAVSALAFATIDEGEPRTAADRAYALSKTIGCPACNGQSIAESAAVIARELRIEIAVWIDEGKDDAFIRARLRERFGDDIDYTPSGDGFTSLVWILPVVFGAGGVAGLVVVFRRWKREGDLSASEADSDLVAATRASRADD